MAALVALLDNPNSSLKDLQLVLCSLNDEGADLFAPHLANNSSLRKLNLSNIRNITTAGWRAIFTHLQSPQSLLEELLLWGNLIDDDNANLLAASLAPSSIISGLPWRW